MVDRVASFDGAGNLHPTSYIVHARLASRFAAGRMLIMEGPGACRKSV